jgi:transcriptional regulator with XRE-family HTH domain
MPKKAKGTKLLISDAARQAIQSCGMSRYELSKLTGVDQAALSRFMSGERGLAVASLDLLAPVLGLQLVVNKKTKPARTGGSNRKEK